MNGHVQYVIHKLFGRWQWSFNISSSDGTQIPKQIGQITWTKYEFKKDEPNIERFWDKKKKEIRTWKKYGMSEWRLRLKVVFSLLFNHYLGTARHLVPLTHPAVAAAAAHSRPRYKAVMFSFF